MIAGEKVTGEPAVIAVTLSVVRDDDGEENKDDDEDGLILILSLPVHADFNFPLVYN